ncbi:hypothetical protein JXA47_09670 [Candidatus Sumerlaeota bacterium]|nr:hypothetical protein [Candidatus Sumerlaeota bacterium]
MIQVRNTLLLIGGALCLLATPTHARAAWNIDLFPLLRHESSEEEDRSELDLLWPLVEWSHEPRHTLRTIRPLMAWEENEDEGWRELDILWPLVHFRRDRIGEPDRERWHLRILPVLNWKRHASPNLAPWRLTLFPLWYAGQTGPDPDQGYRILFPLWWRAQDTRLFFPIFWSSPRSFHALFPLWGEFEDLWGRDEVRFVLFPLWSRSRRESGAITDTVLWPFFAWTRGGPFHGLRAWPLFGTSREEGKWLEGFFLWPLGHFRRGELPDGRPNNLTFFLPFRLRWEIGDTRLNVRWPLWGTYHTPGHDTWTVAWPLWMHTVNRRHRWVEDRALWFIFRWRRGETHRALELMPLAGRRETPTRRLRYLLFPIATHWERHGEERSRDVRALLPLFIRSMTTEHSDESWRRTTWVFPLFLRRERSDGSRETHWLFPLFITRSGPYERSWGALFRFVESGRREDGSHWLRVFRRVYRREVDADGTLHSDYNGLILRRIREGSEVRTSLFGPLVLRTSDLDGTRWSWFNSGEGH